MQVYGLTTDIGLYALLVAWVSGAMVGIGAIIGLKRGFRRMLNE